MAPESDLIITAKDRTLAHLALATEGDESFRPCPDVADLALLIDGRLSPARQEEMWQHLAACPTCYEAWRIVAEQQDVGVKKRSLAKIISIGGGLLAVAASLMLFVNIQSSPVVTTAVMEPVIMMDEASRDRVEFEAPAPAKQEVAEEEQVERIKKQTKSMNRARTQKENAASPALRAIQPASGGYGAEPGSMAKLSSVDDAFDYNDHEDIKGEILLDINRVIPTLLQRLKQVGTGESIEVKTYKRDRGFSVEKGVDGQILIREFGFHDQELRVDNAKLKKTLKTIIKTEFPRSNKAWLRVNR